MSMTNPLASSRLSSRQLHHIKPCYNNTTHQTFFFNPLSQLPISNHKINGNGFSFPCNRSLRYLFGDGKRAQSDNNSKMDFVIYNSTNKQGDLISSGPLLNSWKAWILGGLLTVILPIFLTNKWSPSLKSAKNLEIVEEKVEEIAVTVEKVAEEVEKVIEEIKETLPDGEKLKSAVASVEKVANKAVNNADKIKELIEKVENTEKKVDSVIEAEVDKSNAATKVDTSTT